MAIQIKNDAILDTDVNPLIGNLDTRLTVVENKFDDYLPLAGGGVTGDLSVGGTITGTLNGNATSATKAINNATYNVPFYKYNGYRTKRDFTNGTNVITDLDGGTASSSMPGFLHVKGNGYGGGTVNFICSGYVYMLGNGYSTYISINATSHGTSYPTQIKAYKNSDGFLCFGGARVAYGQGFNVWCSNEAEAQNSFNVYNHVTSVTDIAFPSNAQGTTNISVTAH